MYADLVFLSRMILPCGVSIKHGNVIPEIDRDDFFRRSEHISSRQRQSVFIQPQIVEKLSFAAVGDEIVWES